MSDPYADAQLAADVLGPHDVAIVMGSGWSEAADAVGTAERSRLFGELPGFIPPAVLGHGGTADTVVIGGLRVLLLRGRVHLYEGYGAATVVHAVRAAVLCGCRQVTLTNACGGMRPENGQRPGQIVVLSDHLNWTGNNPMAGLPPPAHLPGRFADLTDLYSARLRAVVRSVDPTLSEGVYVGYHGGSFETPAEIRMLRGWGGDVVGMSTVLEAIAAHHLGAEVLGLSLITNLAAGLASTHLSHDEVLAEGTAASPRLGELLRQFVLRLATESGAAK